MMKEKAFHDTLARVKRLGFSLAICFGVLFALLAPIEQVQAQVVGGAIGGAIVGGIAGGGGPETMDVGSFFEADTSWGEILKNVTDTLWKTIFAIASAAFLVGALMFTTGFVSEENKSKGKNLMIGALVGMAIALSAKPLLDTAYFFVYGSN